MNEPNSIDDISNYSETLSVYIPVAIIIGGLVFLVTAILHIRYDLVLPSLGLIAFGVFLAFRKHPNQTLRIDYTQRVLSRYRSQCDDRHREFEVPFEQISKIELKNSPKSGISWPTIGLYFYTKNRREHRIYSFSKIHAFKLDEMAKRLAQELSCPYTQSNITSRVAIRYPDLFNKKNLVWRFFLFAFFLYILAIPILQFQPNNLVGILMAIGLVGLLVFEVFLFFLNFFIVQKPISS